MATAIEAGAATAHAPDTDFIRVARQPAVRDAWRQFLLRNGYGQVYALSPEPDIGHMEMVSSRMIMRLLKQELDAFSAGLPADARR